MPDILDEDEDDVDFEVAIPVKPSSDKAIEKDFDSGRLRVVQDRNDFFLPHVVDFIEGRAWGNLTPEYQRRLRWDNTKKSRLIESFLMNVPVPPVFLYEKDIGAFEVMDGQQRLNAILEFMKGEYALTGLKIWPSLNGRTFPQLPPLIRKGLERAKISAITLMSDSSMSTSDNIDLRAQVFDRLNTGGEQLNAQELRNSLYSGEFNKLIISLASERAFTDAWDIPPHDENTLSDSSPSKILREHSLFKRMADCEIVLRFFAFREDKYISGSTRSMLNGAMIRHRNVNQKVLSEFQERFRASLMLAIEIFGDQTFRLIPTNGKERGNLSRPLFDAVMVALDLLHESAATILERKVAVRDAITKLIEPDSTSYELVVGRPNTAIAVKGRISAVKAAIAEQL